MVTATRIERPWCFLTRRQAIRHQPNWEAEATRRALAFAAACSSMAVNRRKTPMDFEVSPRCAALQERLLAFMDEHIYPNEQRFAAEIADNRRAGNAWVPSKLMEELKPKARAAGLWNLFLPQSPRVPEGLSNLDYAPLCEIMGRVHFAAEVFNCSAPDTGNMETFERYASEELKRQWLDPLLEGRLRSAFLMTEPDVASSDATNIQCSIRRDGDDYVIDGRKWWSSGAGDPRCKVYIVMGKTNPDAERHAQQSMIIVPSDTPGIEIVRPLSIFGYDDAPHGHMEVSLKGVRVPAGNVLLGEGRGFEIAQGRLGPGRIHHCMRSIGAAERALELMCKRLAMRTAFGKPLSEQSVWHERIAESRCMIDQARLLTLKAAAMMDSVGNKAARAEIAMIKVVAPNMAAKIIDWAMQAHGGGGMSDDFPLAYMYTWQRSLRFADGPDEVHRAAIAKIELRKHNPGRNAR
jgi:acyl-CoA dehydrogenase